MQKYGDSGDKIHSLNAPISSNGKQIEHIDIMTYSESIFFEHDDPLKKDIYEQLIKDCTFFLLKSKRITKLDANILLHSHGIDEYFPKKTAKEIGILYNKRNTEIRTRRFNTARKVIQEIRNA